MDYPTITTQPDSDTYKEEPAADPTIRSAFENGALLTRPRFTKSMKKWTFGYSVLPNADKNTLENFEQNTAVYGSAQFNWIDPINNVSHIVRFAQPVTYQLANNLQNDWIVSVVLIGL